jgi:phytoene dehydrogenase-like protein
MGGLFGEMKITIPDKDVIIVGAGLAGLSCARRLKEDDIPFLVLEADQRIGGRLKTDELDGFILNHGFQVLQTAYPEARRVLNYDQLELKSFAPGAMIRLGGKFYRIADPRRRPWDLWSTIKAPIGTPLDRLRTIRLAHKLRQSTVAEIFQKPDMPTVEFLRAEGFSEKIIQKFFKPFFAGVCLDPEIKTSSRVFRHIYRVFAEGDAALPSRGMAAITRQLAEGLPGKRIRTGSRVQSIAGGEVVLDTGERIKGHAVVLATEGPETARLLRDRQPVASQGEWCLYFSAKEAPVAEPYLILNGEDTGLINSLTVPSIVAPTYAPAGRHLISVVVIGHIEADEATVETTVRQELTDWFGPEVADWRHVKSYRISHALPSQLSPMPDPTAAAAPLSPGLFVCGEYGSVPGIQWAMLSGRRIAEAIINNLAK